MGLKWNLVDKATFTLSNSNLTATSTTTQDCCRATVGRSTGKWYYSVLFNSGNTMIGVARSIATIYSSTSGFSINTAAGKKYGSSAAWSAAAYSTAIAVNSIIDLAIDFDALSATYYKNSVSLGSFTFALTGSGLIYPALFSPGAVGKATIIPSTDKIAGYSWWDPSIDFTPRRTTDILNYGIAKSIFR